MHTNISRNNSTDPSPGKRIRPLESTAKPLFNGTHAIQRKACACGGSCPNCQADKNSIQTKLAISKPTDASEKEANRISEAVMSGNSSNADSIQQSKGSSSSVQRKSMGDNPVTTSPIINEAANDSGKPLDETTRSFMEPRLGNDLSGVRIHTGDKAAQSSEAINASAYTVGNHIVFGKDQYSPQTHSGKKLLAHELVHTDQQNSGQVMPMIQRAVTPDYAVIEDALTYGLFDWAITDAEAKQVLGILNGLSDRDLADTVAAMDRDGYVDRLLDNIAREDEETNAVLIGRINRHRSTSHSAGWIISRLSYGVFDWMITDDDAHMALQALMGLESQELRTVVAKMINSDVFDRLEEELPEEDLKRYPAFFARLHAIRDAFNALVNSHLAHLRKPPPDKPDAPPANAGAVIKKTTDTTGYGGSKATWNDLSDEKKKDWKERAKKAIKKVKESVRGTDLEPILSRGELVFIPEEAEKLNAYAYVSGVNKLYFGRDWVTDAEADPKNVWQSIAHELGGHEEFGETWSWEIMQGTMKKLTPEEKKAMMGSGNSFYSAYGYLETEIYAELRELPHRVAGSGGDLPKNDVPKELGRIKDAFGPEVGKQIAMRLYYRIMDDPRIEEFARRLLYDSIQKVFNLFPITENIAP